MKTKGKKIVKTKLSISWYFAFYLLQTFYSYPEIMSDNKFRKKFDDLLNYTCDKITTPYDSDMKDLYVIAVQEAPIE